MNSPKKNGLFMGIIVVLLIIIIVLVWNRTPSTDEQVSQAVKDYQNGTQNVPQNTQNNGWVPAESVKPTPKPTTTTKPATSGTSGTSVISSAYYTPKGTQIILPLYYSTSNQGDVFRLAAPQQNTTVTSPFNVSGEARGSWYSEGSFPVILTDAKNRVLVRGQAKAKANWQTNDFVPFITTLSFARQPSGSKGFLIIQNANPSGLSQNDKYAQITVTFQ